MIETDEPKKMSMLERLQSSSRPMLGTWLKLSAIEVVEILADAGFDFIVIDLEHSPLDLSSAFRAITLAQALGMSALVRVPDHGHANMQRMLDSGASGILVPHVSSATEAEKVSKQMLFEPLGSRGIGSTSRAGRWGTMKTEEYVSYGNSQILRIPQIEESRAVDNVAEILRVDGINSVFLGPADLAQSMGLSPSHAGLDTAKIKVLTAANEAGIPCGTAVGNSEDAKKAISEGFSFVMVSNDLTMLASSARTLLHGIKSD